MRIGCFLKATSDRKVPNWAQLGKVNVSQIRPVVANLHLGFTKQLFFAVLAIALGKVHETMMSQFVAILLLC